jgi:hypothetical protein
MSEQVHPPGSEPLSGCATALCGPHGLHYDPRMQRGCVLCRRDVPAGARLPRADRSGRRWAGLGLGCVLVAVAVVLWTRALPALQPDGAQHPALGRIDAQLDATQPGAAAPALAKHASEPASTAHTPLRVLFIGNSLTFVNEMPAMIGRLAAAAGARRRFGYRRETPGGYGFSEHLSTGQYRRQLVPGAWDFVVLQDQGQRASWRAPAQLENEFYAPARNLVRELGGQGLRTVFYQTFARRDGDGTNDASDTYDAMQDRINAGYANIGRELRVPVVPVGASWRIVRAEHPDLPLWVPDGLHPTVAGSYLAACAFYAYFYGLSPTGNPYDAGLGAALARTLQDAATRAWVDKGSPRAP